MITQSHIKELERFKCEINLAQFATTLGYVIDKKESSRASLVMRREADKIVVSTSPQGHGIYFSVRDDRDNGSIIDFLQRRESLNLGQVRQALRKFLGQSPTPFPIAPKPIPIPPDRQQLVTEVLRMKEAAVHPYLINERKLSPNILANARFSTQVRVDKRGNAIFPHRDQNGITGYEIKNKNYSGFSPGGTKAFWQSNNLEDARHVVITESAIDALSHAQISRDQELAYISLGGTLSPKQRDLLERLIEILHRRGAMLIIATDNDEGGDLLNSQIQDLAPNPEEIYRERPTAKDWNDELRINPLIGNSTNKTFLG